jgi:2-amino-4-hydroxy-6-hydroxymethyldihydropteridine diphosphokinase
MALVYLSLGSNTGNRQAFLTQALTHIEDRIGTIMKKSSLYETGSWGFVSENFLNQVVEVNTALVPLALIAECLDIEKGMGRERNNQEGYSPRVIDIDILFYDSLILQEEQLVIPHPHIHTRRFILVPLNEIAAELIHPVFHNTVSQLLAECSDGGMVTVFE